MRKADFKIGQEFFSTTGRWICTDVGTRVICAIKKDMEDESWYSGPPYPAAETVFDENDQEGCVATYDQAVSQWGDEFIKAEKVRRTPITASLKKSAEDFKAGRLKKIPKEWLEDDEDPQK